MVHRRLLPPLLPLLPLLLALLLPLQLAASAEHPAASADDPLAAVLRLVDRELDALGEATHAAEAAGVDCYLERASLEVGRYFRAVASQDNTSASMTQLLGHYEFFYADAPEGFAAERARGLPVREANDTLALLRNAMSALSAARRQQPSARPSLPSRSMLGATVCDGYLCNTKGQPVIPVGLNVWGFPRSPSPFDEQAAGISLVTTGFGVDQLLENLTLPDEYVTRLRAELDAAAAKNISIHTLGFGSMPAWAEQKWPGIISGNFTQHGVNFDISSPGVPILLRAGIKDLFARIGCHPALGGFILGNEVTFMQSSTPATIASYRFFLHTRYKNNIGLLNQAWDLGAAGLSSFDGVLAQPAKPTDPVTSGGQAAQWMDWNLFNNARVTELYTVMADAIHAAASATDPAQFHEGCNTTTLKLQDGNEWGTGGGLRFKGIDREALVDVLDWNGCDSGIASNTGLDSRGRINAKSRVANPPPNLANPKGGGQWSGEGWLKLYDKDRYAADWLSQSAGYTLQRSLGPQKPLYDTEWHSISTLSWRDEYMTPEYAKLAVWSSLYHGLALNVAWYFPREGLAPQPASKFAGSLVGSFATLPQVTDIFLREHMVASAVGDIVAGLGRLRPTIWILRSMASDTQDETSTVALLAAFEAASFLGQPLGFLTERQLQAGKLDHPGGGNRSTDGIVIVPNSTFVDDLTVAKLQQRPSAATILATNTSAACLRFSPSGVPRTQPALRKYVDSLDSVPILPAPQMQKLLRAQLLSRLPQPAAWCTDPAEPQAGPIFGVLCRFADLPVPEDGTSTAAGRGSGTYGYVINMLAQRTTIGLRRRGDAPGGVAVMEGIDVRDGLSLTFAGGALELEPGAVLLVRI